MEGFSMKKKWVYLDDAEWRAIIRALNEFRNKLISEGSYTDFIDEIMIKVINAPIKKVKVKAV